MGSVERFTRDEAANLIEKAGKAQIADAEKNFDLPDLIALANDVGIDHAFLERALLQRKLADLPAASSSATARSEKRNQRPIHIHQDADYLVLTAEPIGWTPPIVARVLVWTACLGFIGQFVGRGIFNLWTLLITLPFIAWSAWSLVRVVLLTRRRVLIAMSKTSFSVRTVGRMSQAEFGGDIKRLRVSEPRMARSPEGGIEVFPIYFLRLQTDAGEIDTLLGHREADLRRVSEAIEAWRARLAEQAKEL
jgi:hypothetical protein